ncbi:MAG TPA: hypothetical protein VGX25_35030 [Actinophytocola sp.]|uniref:hypothetical protein n=1 Tax=Actinophytocola sp. TaxID=1872138 RepID=UPI002DDCEC26|nr:hypothetical protein [Actinophytocola sp.]HEV2784627.1 hypothetical protein [Actinophytocola sp.]
MRTDDVIAVATKAGARRQEFFRRWATRDEFLPDAVVYALLRDYDGDDPRQHVRQLPSIPDTTGPVSRGVIAAADGLLAALVRHPRSYLMLHLGPLLPRHPGLWSALLPGACAATRTWIDAYQRLVTRLDLTMRPEWTTKRVALVLQAMLDGFVLRYRLNPHDYPTSRWAGASIFADAVIAFMIGAVDWDLTGQPGRAALDNLVRPAPFIPHARGRGGRAGVPRAGAPAFGGY